MIGASPETVTRERDRDTAKDSPPETTEKRLETPRKPWKEVDDMFDVLSNHRRRRVLMYLEENETAVVGELAEHVAAIENDKPISALSSQERKRVYIALYQSHLPKMSAASAVEYDKNRGTVSLSEAGAGLCSLLKDPARSRRWSTRYLVHTAATVLALVVGTIFLGVSASLVSGVFLTGYALLAVVHRAVEYAAPVEGSYIDIGMRK